MFNTYGEQSNSDLLHMYGFVEKYPENVNDVVEIGLDAIEDALRKNPGTNRPDLLDAKIGLFDEIDAIGSDFTFVIGHDGLLNEVESMTLFEVFYIYISIIIFI